MLKNSKLFYFCHLKKLVRPETFGPYCVQSASGRISHNLGEYSLGQLTSIEPNTPNIRSWTFTEIMMWSSCGSTYCISYPYICTGSSLSRQPSRYIRRRVCSVSKSQPYRQFMCIATFYCLLSLRRSDVNWELNTGFSIEGTTKFLVLMRIWQSIHV